MRIVSLAPALTELCIALGRGPYLVGVDDDSDAPETAGLPRVGGLVRPEVATIRSLRPDLILVFDLVPGSVSPTQGLDGSDLPVEVVGAENLADVYALFIELGDLLGCRRRGEDLAADLERRLRRSAGQLPALHPAPRTYVELWPKPVLALGARSWIHDLLELAGGANCFGDEPSPNVRVDEGAVAKRDPDVVLVTWGRRGASLSPVRNRPGWNAVPAFRDGRIGSVAVDGLKRPGPRLADGFAVLAGELRRLAEGL